MTRVIDNMPLKIKFIPNIEAMVTPIMELRYPWTSTKTPVYRRYLPNNYENKKCNKTMK